MQNSLNNRCTTCMGIPAVVVEYYFRLNSMKQLNYSIINVMRCVSWLRMFMV